MRKLCRITSALALLLIVAGCGGGGGGDPTYNFTVTSATFFTASGEQVAVVRFTISGSCVAPTGVVSAITRVGAATVVNPGTVSFSFTTGLIPPMLESVYIDINASGNLDFGDQVWGNDPNDLGAFCFDNYALNQVIDWDVIAVNFGSTMYTGPTQAFRSETDSELELMIDNAIIVDGDGYDSIKW